MRFRTQQIQEYFSYQPPLPGYSLRQVLTLGVNCIVYMDVTQMDCKCAELFFFSAFRWKLVWAHVLDWSSCKLPLPTLMCYKHYHFTCTLCENVLNIVL